jgi:AraC-like DNA-binding protein
MISSSNLLHNKSHAFSIDNSTSNISSLHHSIDSIHQMIMDNNTDKAIEIYEHATISNDPFINHGNIDINHLKIFLVTLESVIAHTLIRNDLDPFLIDDSRSHFFNRIINTNNYFKLSQVGKCIIKTYCKILHQTDFLHKSTDVKKVILYIQNNFKNKILIDDICKIVNLSKSHVCKSFKKETDVTINEYIKKTRIHHCKYLLQNSNLSLLDIALETGFESHSYFTKVFKTETGVTPKQFRCYSNIY